MFAAWGFWVARHRRSVLAVTLLAVLGAGLWGAGVFGQLSEGGYNDPNSESSRAADVVRAALGAQGADLVVIYTPTGGSIDNAVLGQRVLNRLGTLPREVVTGTDSYWSGDRPQYASADKSKAVAVLTLAGQSDGEKLASYQLIAGDLDVQGATDQVAGAPVLGDASASLSTRDLAFAEVISLPIVLVLLLFIFGSLVAAALPVLVGGAAVLGSLGVLHAVAVGHEVNSFAVNVASLLGLGMAIDYGLFIVGRFREEQAAGRTTEEAVSRTLATAGRTVLFSATLLMIALGGLLLFPQGFLKSLAYGGLSAVGLAAILSLSLLPAVLAVLGPRVDKLPVRLPRRRTPKPAGTGWARLAGLVLSHPVLVALPIVAGLLVLAVPIAGVQFGENDERVLPASEPARTAIETLKADFPALCRAGVQVVLRGTRGGAPVPAAVKSFTAAVAKVPGVTAVTPSGSGATVAVLTATLADHDPFSPAARTAVDDIRALTPPSDSQLLVGGTTARNVDSLHATAQRLPLTIALLVGATLVLMFLAFGSILLPLKAVAVSALSLSATFGILVWIFQDGHGAGLLRVTPAPLEAGIVVLMAAVVFGLSTDYEVFLLSRMVEARTRGASTAEAVTTGLARTGRVISAAAVLLIVVTGAFALSSVTTMRFVGVGMIIALLLDATVVRMLLVPAILKLLGDAAWWAPGPLRRLQQRAGLSEYAGEELFPTVSVGRHAAPGTAVAVNRSSSAAPRHASASRPAAATGPASAELKAPWTQAVAGLKPAATADHAASAGASETSAAAATTGTLATAPDDDGFTPVGSSGADAGLAETARIIVQPAVPAPDQPALTPPAPTGSAPDQPPEDQPGPDQPGPDQPGPDQPGPDQPGLDQPAGDRLALPGRKLLELSAGEPPEPAPSERQAIPLGPPVPKALPAGPGEPDRSGSAAATATPAVPKQRRPPDDLGAAPTVRITTGEHHVISPVSGAAAALRKPTGEQPGVSGTGAGTGEPRDDAGQWPSTGTGDAAQTDYGTGERPQVRSLPPVTEPAEREIESMRTVDLAARLHTPDQPAAPDPADPDALRTVDLAAQIESDGSRHHA